MILRASPTSRTSENEAIESDNIKLDLDEYGATYNSWPVVQLLAQVCGIQNVYRNRRDIVDFQDFIAVSRAPIPGLERWTRSSLIRGCIDRVAAVSSDRLRVSGWVGDVSRPGPVRDLQLHLDGKAWDAEITLGSPRADVAQATERPGWSESGWSVEGSTAAISPGRHLLTATAEGTCFALEWHQLPPGS